MRSLWFATAPCAVVLCACAPAATEEADEQETESISEAERWSAQDDPGMFGGDLVRLASALPAAGHAATLPWAGSFWPASKDSINHRWDGATSPSPAEKYQLAFGGEGVEDKVSQTEGVDSLTTAKTCTAKKDCESGEACAKRRGATSGRCVPTWYGICDGWTAASILFPEPRREVVRNGVTFKVQDIKALLTIVSTETTSRFTSLRCEETDKEGKLVVDADGRPATPCRDTNPGTFHVLLGNYLGLQGKAFAADKTFDQEVWNHPIRRYRVVAQKVVTPEEANRLLGAVHPDHRATEYTFNPAAASLLHVKTDVSYVVESAAETDGPLAENIGRYTTVVRYEYVLELDARGLIVGGEWVGDSKRRHPDFLWLPLRPGRDPVARGAISLSRVQALAAASVAPAP